MPGLTEQKRFALDWIGERARRFSDWHLRIWEYAEPAWREYKSAKAYCDLLRAEGFEVEEGSGGMPTAFAATWGKGGPVLGSYAEYDAVPGNSQQVVPYQAPRAGLHPWAAGHTETQAPSLHSWPSAQPWPHAPQLALSTLRSTQAPEQAVSASPQPLPGSARCLM